jgi:hypothetical protein
VKGKAPRPWTLAEKPKSGKERKKGGRKKHFSMPLKKWRFSQGPRVASLDLPRFFLPVSPLRTGRAGQRRVRDASAPARQGIEALGPRDHLAVSVCSPNLLRASLPPCDAHRRRAGPTPVHASII